MPEQTARSQPARVGAASWLTRLLRPRRPDGVRVIAVAEARRILAIKIHDQLGDFLLATPALRALRRRFPEARLVLVTRAFLEPLARGNPDLDAIWTLPRVRGFRGLGGLLSVVASVAGFRPDLTFVLNSVSRSKTADALAALSRARRVVGRSEVGAGQRLEAPAGPVAAGRPARDAVYDLDIPVGPASDHQTDRYLDLVRWCGAEGPPTLVLALTEDERRAGTRAIAAAGGGADTPRPWVGFHPGAANPLKSWPLDSWVALGGAIGRESGPRVGTFVVFDSPRERGRAAALCAGLASRQVPSVFLPASSIRDFAARCASLDLLVCNDSGVMHVAAALGVPTVSFHALGPPAEWAPRNDHAVALYAPRNIASIPVSAALEAVRRLLELRGSGEDVP